MTHHLSSNPMRLAALLCGIVILTLAWAGCSTNSSPEGSGQGTMEMYLSDAPADFDGVFLVITRVEAHVENADSSSGWFVLKSDSTTVELLHLRNGANVLLTSAALPAGHYTQFRFILGSGSYIVISGVQFPLIVPSGMQTGVKVDCDATLQANTTFRIMVDFDADRSIHETGNGKWMMNPVIHCIPMASSGAIAGVVLPLAAHARVWTTFGTDTLTTTADTLTGVFMLASVPEGKYNVTIQARGGSYRDTTIDTVAVVRQRVTVMDTVRLTAK